MNISVCITVLNEESGIAKLLDSLLAQTKKPNEIIVVDGGSSDRTIEIITHYQKKDRIIKLLKEKCSRARGRNLGVEIAKGDIIAITDAGCIAEPNWIKNLTSPFENKEVEVVAGFYKMTALNPFEEAESVFLGVAPENFNVSFLPSARSLAFRKETWEKVGGFPESLEDTAEDTVFNYKLLKAGVKYARVKDAIVGWGMPTTLKDFYKKVFFYAKGDAKTKILFFPGKGLMSHNIKAILVFLRYILGIILVIFSFNSTPLLFILLILISLYLFRAYKKAGFWGVVLQFTSDFAVMSGFLSGILGR